MRFHFTLGYKGTSLENVHVIDGIQEWAVPRSGMYNVQAGEASGGGIVLVIEMGQCTRQKELFYKF